MMEEINTPPDTGEHDPLVEAVESSTDLLLVLGMHPESVAELIDSVREDLQGRIESELAAKTATNRRLIVALQKPEPATDSPVPEEASPAIPEPPDDSPTLSELKALRQLKRIFEGILEPDEIEALQGFDVEQRQVFLSAVERVYRAKVRKQVNAASQVSRLSLLMEGNSVGATAEVLGQTYGAVKEGIRALSELLPRGADDIRTGFRDASEHGSSENPDSLT